MKICCISDSHERHEQLEIPTCDLLLHAGDITMMGAPEALQRFNDWCSSLLQQRVVRKIILIAGNHDFLLERDPRRAESLLTASTYLQDSGVEWEGKQFWGTPWQPWFYDWAFNLHTEEELMRKFQRVPAGTDVLISHGPPKGILDQTINGDHVGSNALLEKIQEIRPRFVIFGHIHESYGIVEQNGITFVNASSCDVRYRLANKPIVLTF